MSYLLTAIPFSTHSGVCHSDMGVMECTWRNLPFPTQPGQVGGHEGVGIVHKMGPGNEQSQVKLGDRVGIKWVAYACQACPPCLEGRDGVCFVSDARNEFLVAWLII